MEFPFKTRLSLQGIIEFWEEKEHSPNKLLSESSKILLNEIRKIALPEHIDDLGLIQQHKETIEMLMSPLFPSGLGEDEIIAAFKPFSMDYFFGTKRFHALVEEAGCMANMASNIKVEDMLRTKTVGAYQAILKQFYGLDLPSLDRFPLSLAKENGLVRYYYLHLNPKFCQIRVNGELPELSQKQLQEIVNDLPGLEKVMEYLPPELFEFVGFGLYSMQDATQEVIVSSIKEILLKKESMVHQKGILELEHHFRSLLHSPFLQLGFSLFAKDHRNGLNVAGSRSLMENDGNFYEPYINIASRVALKKEIYVITNVKEDSYFEGSGMLINKEFNSLFFAPLIIEEKMIGILELASESVGNFNSLTYNTLAEIIPLFAIALERSNDEKENRIQSIIKEHYTSIHPTVEWRFNSAAKQILLQEQKGLKIEPEEIVFPEVYPIYAASDIRDSSKERNRAIVADLSTQLKLAKKVLSDPKVQEGFPLVDEIVFRINQALNKLKKGLISGDEITMVHFVKTEVEPLIRLLEKEFVGFSSQSKTYWNRLDNELKIVYERRKDFESSLTVINETISAFLEKEQEKAQEIFPHFFEKYKTDGVEYNAYIGSSISKDKKFSKQHLKNLRLWQLLTAVEIARKTELIKPTLKVPLETTHLILVHSQPLSVRFRMDEKQFDVDGAYNMRYEIVKKRIDKVNIKHTEERLTQPNKLAVVFSTDEDEIEYKQYFEYLNHNGLISNSVETLELEDLQGVSGLKAIRVSLEMRSKTFESELNRLKEVSFVKG